MAFWSTSCVLRRPLSDAAGWAEQSGQSARSVGAERRLLCYTAMLNQTSVGCWGRGFQKA
ncbi:hypothetical protein EYF80_038247 [Liparis tanakae]|uniref:Uncharacterized protein n=1 Tax=Liparis tanakae TaxID=230148 RepID=A0A4Z2GDD5_9TELE|nr:hypothetical protein EYF80_038247 [Liparis tanakae]